MSSTIYSQNFRRSIVLPEKYQFVILEVHKGVDTLFLCDGEGRTLGALAHFQPMLTREERGKLMDSMYARVRYGENPETSEAVEIAGLTSKALRGYPTTDLVQAVADTQVPKQKDKNLWKEIEKVLRPLGGQVLGIERQEEMPSRIHYHLGGITQTFEYLGGKEKELAEWLKGLETSLRAKDVTPTEAPAQINADAVSSDGGTPITPETLKADGWSYFAVHVYTHGNTILTLGHSESGLLYVSCIRHWGFRNYPNEISPCDTMEKLRVWAANLNAPINRETLVFSGWHNHDKENNIWVKGGFYVTLGPKGEVNFRDYPNPTPAPNNIHGLNALADNLRGMDATTQKAPPKEGPKAPPAPADTETTYAYRKEIVKALGWVQEDKDRTAIWHHPCAKGELRIYHNRSYICIGGGENKHDPSEQPFASWASGITGVVVAPDMPITPETLLADGWVNIGLNWAKPTDDTVSAVEVRFGSIKEGSADLVYIKVKGRSSYLVPIEVVRSIEELNRRVLLQPHKETSPANSNVTLEHVLHANGFNHMEHSLYGLGDGKDVRVWSDGNVWYMGFSVERFQAARIWSPAECSFECWLTGNLTKLPDVIKHISNVEPIDYRREVVAALGWVQDANHPMNWEHPTAKGEVRIYEGYTYICHQEGNNYHNPFRQSFASWAFETTGEIGQSSTPVEPPPSPIGRKKGTMVAPPTRQWYDQVLEEKGWAWDVDTERWVKGKATLHHRTVWYACEQTPAGGKHYTLEHFKPFPEAVDGIDCGTLPEEGKGVEA